MLQIVKKLRKISDNTKILEKFSGITKTCEVY
jgi:hypothetical protein